LIFECPITKKECNKKNTKSCYKCVIWRGFLIDNYGYKKKNVNTSK